MLLECRNFSFAIGKNPILKDISFAIGNGAWLSIIGPNGSGKSTLLKNLLRLVSGRASGEIRINSRPIGAYTQKELARLLAYVPQASGPVPPFTVREFSSLSRYSYGFADSNADGESVERALELTDTLQLASRRLDTLSGGQRQRAFLAAALAQGTEILLLDEPCAFLDPRHAQAMHALLKRLRAEIGMTIAIVTHDLNQPLDAGGHVLVLNQGRQLHFGASADLLGQGLLERAFSHDFSYMTHPRTGRPVVLA